MFKGDVPNLLHKVAALIKDAHLASGSHGLARDGNPAIGDTERIYKKVKLNLLTGKYLLGGHIFIPINQLPRTFLTSCSQRSPRCCIYLAKLETYPARSSLFVIYPPLPPP